MWPSVEHSASASAETIPAGIDRESPTRWPGPDEWERGCVVDREVVRSCRWLRGATRCGGRGVDVDWKCTARSLNSAPHRSASDFLRQQPLVTSNVERLNGPPLVGGMDLFEPREGTGSRTGGCDSTMVSGPSDWRGISLMWGTATSGRSVKSHGIEPPCVKHKAEFASFSGQNFLAHNRRYA
jgi:hypothetical protein